MHEQPSCPNCGEAMEPVEPLDPPRWVALWVCYACMRAIVQPFAYPRRVTVTTRLSE